MDVKFPMLNGDILNANDDLIKVKTKDGIKKWAMSEIEKLDIYDYDVFDVYVGGSVVFTGRVNEEFFDRLLILYKHINKVPFDNKEMIFEVQKKKYKKLSLLLWICGLIASSFIFASLRERNWIFFFAFFVIRIVISIIKRTKLPKNPQNGKSFTILDDILMTVNPFLLYFLILIGFGVLVNIASLFIP